MVDLKLGDSNAVLRSLPDNSIDSVITDPPYGLNFMGKKWDYDVPSVDLWKEVFRVLKPGGHLLSFGGTRTYHRLVVAIEDAGFEIRDQIQWIYGSGFPKSHDVSKGIDKQAGAERKVIGKSPNWRPAKTKGGAGFDKDIGEGPTEMHLTAPSTDSAKQWQGWGTALKPANEPICVARKPLEKGLTVAENVLKWGTGAINIDATRVGSDLVESGRAGRSKTDSIYQDGLAPQTEKQFSQGRWPANVLLDEQAAFALDEQSGLTKGGGKTKVKTDTAQMFGMKGHVNVDYPDSGGASRFFYVAKASKRERNEGLEGMPSKEPAQKYGMGAVEGNPRKPAKCTANEPVQNFHPTVKPVKLMEYLIKLVTPKNGTVLDPFMGSGSTGVAATMLGFKFVGVEMNTEYFEISKKRIGARYGNTNR